MKGVVVWERPLHNFKFGQQDEDGKGMCQNAKRTCIWCIQHVQGVQSLCLRQIWSIHVAVRTRTAKECAKMQNARASEVFSTCRACRAFVYVKFGQFTSLSGRGRQRNVPKCKTYVHLRYSARAGRAEPLFTSNLVNSRRCQDEDGKGMCQNAKRTCIGGIQNEDYHQLKRWFLNTIQQRNIWY